MPLLCLALGVSFALLLYWEAGRPDAAGQGRAPGLPAAGRLEAEDTSWEAPYVAPTPSLPARPTRDFSALSATQCSQELHAALNAEKVYTAQRLVASVPGCALNSSALLAKAVRMREPTLVRLLAQHGAALTAPTVFDSALHAAILSDAGVDDGTAVFTSLVLELGGSSLAHHPAIADTSLPFLYTPLHTAILRTHAPSAQRLTESMGATLDAAAQCRLQGAYYLSTAVKRVPSILTLLRAHARALKYSVPLAWTGPEHALQDPWLIPSCNLTQDDGEPEEEEEAGEDSFPLEEGCPVGEGDFCADFARLMRAGVADNIFELGYAIPSLSPACDPQELLSVALTTGSMDIARWLVEQGVTLDDSEFELLLADSSSPTAPL